MRKIAFHSEAEGEIIEAAKYYETRSSGLGLSFIAEIQIAIEQIVSNPQTYEIVGEDIHRKLLKRFPYSLLYSIESDRILIIAIAHHNKRRPNYWRSRI